MGNKMGKKKDDTMRVKLLPVVGCVLVMLAYATPCSAETIDSLEVIEDREYSIGTGPECDYESVGYITVLDGTVHLLEGAVVNGVEVREDGIVNMSAGAYVGWFVYAYGGGTVNIHGGEVIYGVWIIGDVPQQMVTVYGTSFFVNDVPCSADWFVPAEGVMTMLTGVYENEEPIYLEFYGTGTVPVYLVDVVADVLDVAIDIKPGSDTNPINLKSKGLVPVAVLSANGFVASTVNPQSVRLGDAAPPPAGVEPPPPAAPLRWTMEDVDSDGDKDMLLHFRTEDLAIVLTESTTEVKLTGQTTDETEIEGTDVVQIVPSKPKK